MGNPGNPAKGMHYEDVKKRVKRIEKNAPESQGKRNLVNSLMNQSLVCDGPGAVSELKKEIYNRVGTKSRGNWNMGVCLKGCKCLSCRRESKNIEESEVNDEQNVVQGLPERSIALN